MTSRNSSKFAARLSKGVCIVLVLLVSGCGGAQQPARPTVAQVPVIAARQGTVFPRTTLSGIVAPL
jgi:hypothetical protein